MTEGPAETLNLTEFAQPAIFINSYVIETPFKN